MLKRVTLYLAQLFNLTLNVLIIADLNYFVRNLYFIEMRRYLLTYIGFKHARQS